MAALAEFHADIFPTAKRSAVNVEIRGGLAMREGRG